ncbi:hypothetical protein [Thermomonospora cellulosilytica]|uniref:Serine/threonine protein kinase n=1 Tax=Thermomonospora cellulosilytica TaxID=1411118 RepID=A0A7W3MWX8_9ACTN|nr:hypothetical protein [Thermomonospora cellulosilytica]MBA9003398.1 hypothetical protein [Thermomonospora cellulosilytica]
MQGPYQPYSPIPPGPPVPPPRRDPANVLILLVIVGTVVVALLGTFGYLLTQAGDDDEPEIRVTQAQVTPPPDPRAITEVFAGTWNGSGYYLNTKGDRRNFTATLTLTEGASTGVSTYTGYECTGRLSVESVTATRVVMYETITQGSESGGDCEDAPTGYITLTLDSSGTVEYDWYSTRAKMLSDDTASEATLTRQRYST